MSVATVSVQRRGPDAARVGSKAVATTVVACLVAFAAAWEPRAEADPSADPSAGPSADPAVTESAASWAMHGQITYTEQESNHFKAPYQGTNSLSANQGRETVDGTLMFGRRLWEGAEAWISPEIDQGFGLDNTVGLAGFSSGEAYKVGRNAPYLKLPRVFIRQTINSDEATESIAEGPTQLAGLRSADYWVLTVGKFSVPDIFDVNQYAHDPKVDFLNWTAIDAGTFDYAADAWAYTVGAALERYTGPWTARLGLFDLSTVPNSTHLDPGGHEFQMIAELERRHHIGGQPGKTLVTVYDSRGRMGRLQDAITLALQTNSAPDIAKVRQYRSRTGISLSLEQAIDTNLAVFVRAGKAGGNVEAYEFTDVDRTLSAGLSLKGARWSREADTIGLAAVANGISGVREAYLNAGGLGILAGDGHLPHPGAEQILESYYSCEVRSGVWLTFDYQHITNPAYNRDRGPASVFALRAHAAF